jgi:hypothetical protein
MMGWEETAMLRAAWVLAPALAAGALGAAPLPDADPLLPGTRWAGTLTQKGTFGRGAMGPPAFRTVLTITARSGNRFDGELAEEADDIRVTYRVKGTVAPAAGGKGFAVRFQSTAATAKENTEPVLGVPYTGVLAGKSLRGTWQVSPSGPGTFVEGEFALELGK